MKRKILFVIPNLQHGGAERVVVLLLRHLPRERFELHLALVDRSGPLLDDLPDDVEVHDLAAGRVVRSLGPLRRLVRQLRPDVVVPELSHTNVALVLLRPFLPRATRLLLHEHTTLSAELAEGRSALWSLAYRWLFPRADLVLCCSYAMAHDLVEVFGVPDARVRVVRNPIDEPAIASARERSVRPFAGDGPHLVGLGRLAFEKGYDRLLEAFAALAPRLPAARLWLLGDGPERERLEARAAEPDLSGRVCFEGYCPDPYPWLAHADVLVQASRREGLPVAVLEAVACGARVVAFDCPGGTGEILDGLSGSWLVPDGEIDALAVALEQSLAAGAPRPPGLPAEFRLERVVDHFSALLERG